MKNRLNNLIRWILFFIAYYPLFLILLIQHSKLIDRIFAWDFTNFRFIELNDVFLWGIILGLIIFAIITIFLKFQNNTNTIQYKVLSIKDISHETLNYILTYLIVFLSLDMNSPKMILSIILLLFIIGLIYINSNMLYVNPILQLLGYSIYELTVTRHNIDDECRIIAISKIGKIKKNEYIDISLVNEGVKNIYFVK
ncbi:TPA: hypothetical protein IAA87_05140 [Candidatus Avigastranaerophilus faecigallinarum]|nr:hypothetical protein [Candidatus Avigastranaerophilus faecigallinarum]